jgi:hypothetical protein
MDTVNMKEHGEKSIPMLDRWSLNDSCRTPRTNSPHRVAQGGKKWYTVLYQEVQMIDPLKLDD